VKAKKAIENNRKAESARILKNNGKYDYSNYI